MNSMTTYRAAAPVECQTMVGGQLVTYTWQGDVTPQDPTEASILADLAAAGVVATGTAGRKQAKAATAEPSTPDTTEE